MLKNFEVIARPLPTEAFPEPEAIRVQVFAPDEVVAKSQFWAVARRVARLKKSHGEVLAVRRVIEPEPNRVKTYGIWLTFRSVRQVHNIYKEFRDTTTEGAVTQLYQEMAGTHNVERKSISIVRVSEIDNSSVKRKQIQQFVEPDVKFPILQQGIRPAHASQKRLLSRKRPTVCGF
jgi:large subunit ribosomal protein L18Ae